MALAVKYDLQCTAGVHPSSTGELESHPSGDARYLEELVEVIEQDQSEGGARKIIAIGEIGLGTSASSQITKSSDYDRLNYSPAETQLRYLARLLALSTRFNLPMFLHSRHPDAHRDMVVHLKELGWGREKGVAFGKGAVIHSFTGTTEEMNEWVSGSACEAGLTLRLTLGCISVSMAALSRRKITSKWLRTYHLIVCCLRLVSSQKISRSALTAQMGPGAHPSRLTPHMRFFRERITHSLCSRKSKSHQRSRRVRESKDAWNRRR